MDNKQLWTRRAIPERILYENKAKRWEIKVKRVKVQEWKKKRWRLFKKHNEKRLHKPYTDKEEIILDLNINENATEYFTSNATFDQHYDAQTENKEKYLATMMALNEYSIEMQANAKSRSLAAAFARRDKPLVDYLLNNEKQIGFVDLLKSLQILDSAREIKSIQKKIATNAELKSVMKSHKLGRLKSNSD